MTRLGGKELKDLGSMIVDGLQSSLKAQNRVLRREIIKKITKQAFQVYNKQDKESEGLRKGPNPWKHGRVGGRNSYGEEASKSKMIIRVKKMKQAMRHL